MFYKTLSANGQHLVGSFPNVTPYINVTQLTELRERLHGTSMDRIISLNYNLIGPQYQLAIPLFNVYPVEAFLFIVAYFRNCYLRERDLSSIPYAAYVTVIISSILSESILKA